MPNTFILLIAFFIFDFIYKQYTQKNKSEHIDSDVGDDNTPTRPSGKTTFADLVKRFEAQFEFESEEQKVEDVAPIVKTVSSDVRREGVESQTRKQRIAAQEAKLMEHSDFEKNRRLKRESVLKKSRLGDSQVTLASRMSKRGLDDYDLDKRRQVSIETLNVENAERMSKASGIINIKDDIIKGVIYSEILAKPKSLQRK